jgi:cysteine desulfurase
VRAIFLVYEAKMIYLDHAASTPIWPEVVTLLAESYATDFANPSAAHRLGLEIEQKIINTKSHFIKIFNGSKGDHFYFLSCATEANNTIVKGININVGDVVLYSKADHRSLVTPIEDLQKMGVECVALKHLKTGQIDFDYLDLWLNENKNKRVALLAISLVNNQSGNILATDELIIKVKDVFKDIHIHIDAVQGFTKIPFLRNSVVDSITIAGHKLGGPKGIAGLFLKNKSTIKPLVVGGGQQENFRSGTEVYPLIKAFEKAVILSNERSIETLKNISILNSSLKEKLQALINNIIFPFENTSPYILTFVIPGIPTDVLLRHFEMKEIYLATTSACSSRIKAFNPTLDALVIPEKWHKNVLRLSMGMQTTEEEIELFLSEFSTIWNDIKFLIKN